MYGQMPPVKEPIGLLRASLLAQLERRAAYDLSLKHSTNAEYDLWCRSATMRRRCTYLTYGHLGIITAILNRYSMRKTRPNVRISPVGLDLALLIHLWVRQSSSACAILTNFEKNRQRTDAGPRGVGYGPISKGLAHSHQKAHIPHASSLEK